MAKYLIDTNILLDFPEIVEDTNYQLFISPKVLKELDNLKHDVDEDRAIKAGKANDYIEENFHNLTFLKEINMLSTDDSLIRAAQGTDFIILTNDTNLIIRAKLAGVAYERYKSTKEDYSGIRHYPVEVDSNNFNQLISDVYDKKVGPDFFQLCNNEFIVFLDQHNVEICTFMNHEGKFVSVEENRIRNTFIKHLRPRNVEQKCLMSLLADDNVSIVAALGKYGTGKSIIMTNYALQQLENGKIDKIYYVPNNSFGKDAREIGTLPGSLLEKEIIHMGTLIDMVGEEKLIEMIEDGTIEIVPISIMRGRNLANCIILVAEAQNLTEDHVKLLIGRMGEKCRLFFDGDIKQTDKFVFKARNGLRLVLKLRNSKVFSSIFGVATLIKTERSFAAQAADYLDNL